MDTIGEHFRSLLAKPDEGDLVLRPDKTGELGIRKPLKPPSHWTKFKASLAKRGLGENEHVQKARQKIEDFPEELRQFKKKNWQILYWVQTHLMKELGTYDTTEALSAAGINLADGIDPTKLNAQLSARKAVKVVSQGKDLAARRNRAESDPVIARYFEGGDGRGTAPFSNKPRGAQRFLRLAAIDQCRKAMPASDSSATAEGLKKAEGEVLAIYSELKACGVSEQALSTILEQACDDEAAKGAPTAGKLVDHARREIVRRVVDAWLDEGNPESLLRRISSSKTKAKGREIPESVLGGFASDITKGLPLDIEKLALALGCDERADQILAMLRPRFERSIHTHIDQWLAEAAK